MSSGVYETPFLEPITRHVESIVGPISSVFHEEQSEVVHLDLLWVEPGGRRNFHTLVTCGMSALPMAVPFLKRKRKDFRFAELVLALPLDWPVHEAAVEARQTATSWPINTLRHVARSTHAHKTWLSFGHTIFEPAEPLGPGTEMTSVFLSYPLLLSEDILILERSDGLKINFLAMIPIYPIEFEFKQHQGADLLADLLRAHGVTELLRLGRDHVISMPDEEPAPSC